jgi:adenylate kinase
LIVVFLGPPAIGKGTQARRIARERGLSVISTGDKLREAVAQGTDVGQEAKKFIDQGQLVPDEVVVRIVTDSLRSINGNGVILDGFPRTLSQAESLETHLEKEAGLDGVLHFEAPTEMLIGRASGRRICRNCQEIYHLEFRPPRSEGVCDACGQETLYQRTDDQEEAVRRRLEGDQLTTQKLVDFYQERGLLARVAADRDVDSIAKDVSLWVEGLS